MLLQQLGWEKGSADWDVIDTFVRIFHTHCQQKAPDVRGGHAAVDQVHMCGVTQECVFWRNGVGSDPPAPPRSLKQCLHMWKPETPLLRVCPPLSSTVGSVAPYGAQSQKYDCCIYAFMQSVCSMKMIRFELQLTVIQNRVVKRHKRCILLCHAYIRIIPFYTLWVDVKCDKLL